MCSAANDPRPEMIPKLNRNDIEPKMIPDADRKS